VGRRGAAGTEEVTSAARRPEMSRAG
jgi:hypothetical protein